MSDAERVINAYVSASATLRSQVLRVVTKAWESLPSYRDADIDRLVDLVVPRVQAGQVKMAELTASYLAKLTGTATTVDRDEVLNGRGVDPEVVYRRPAIDVYRGLAEGKTMAEIAGIGLNRLTSLASTDLQLAHTRQARASLQQSSGVEMFRRQLTGREDCALCTIASTQRYWKGDLQPIHPGCDCAVVPLVGGVPEQQVIDEQLLETAHAAVERFTGTTERGARDLGIGKTVDYQHGGQRLADYTELIMTRTHGEYGPTLTWRGDRFTGPNDLH